ncbi:hypothetical protein D3C81_2290050 [compost metagenome]
MPKQGGFLDAEGFEQLLSITGQLLEGVLVVVRFAGRAEPDLVRGNDPVTGVAQGFD